MSILTEADYDFHLLSDSLRLVDERPSELHAKFEHSRDPDSDGTIDLLAGLGLDTRPGHYPVANAVCAHKPASIPVQESSAVLAQWRDAIHAFQKVVQKLDPAS